MKRLARNIKPEGTQWHAKHSLLNITKWLVDSLPEGPHQKVNA